MLIFVLVIIVVAPVGRTFVFSCVCNRILVRQANDSVTVYYKL